MNEFKPKLFTTLKNYTKEQFIKDIVSGIIVAIIALPLSIAMAIASGVGPERGLYTAIFGGFLVSFLGGSRVQIGGASITFMIVILGILAEFGIDGLMLATMMAGIFLLIFGFAKLGNVIKFIPYPMVTGFTSGIAVIIFSTQINDFFGLGLTGVPSNFFEKWHLYFLNFKSINLTATLMGVLALVIIILWPKISKKIPGTLIALLIISFLVFIFKLDVPTIGSTFGELSTSIPVPKFPGISFLKIKALLPSAFVIAILCSFETLLSAVVSDGMIGSKHNSNMELVAQGAANIGTAFFGGIPVTGTLARTVANIKNGGKTPVAGMAHAITLLIFLVSLMPLIQMIPLSALAAILFVVAYNMSEWREFKSLLKTPKSDVLVLLTTFTLTVAVDLVIAIEVGLVLSMFLFMKRMADVSGISTKVLDFTENTGDGTFNFDEESKKHNAVKGVIMYQINGPFFFGAAYKFVEAINKLEPDVKCLIIGMKHVPAIDATALHSFKSSLKICKGKGITVLITGLRDQPLEALKNAQLYDAIGSDKFFETIEEAYEYAKQNLINKEIKANKKDDLE